MDAAKFQNCPTSHPLWLEKVELKQKVSILEIDLFTVVCSVIEMHAHVIHLDTKKIFERFVALHPRVMLASLVAYRMS